MDDAAIGTTCVGGGCTHGNVGNAVSVEVTQRRDDAERVAVSRNRAAVQRAGNLCGAFGCAIGIQAQNVNRTAPGSTCIVADGTNRQIDDAISVQITQRSQADSKVVCIGQCRPAIETTGNLHRQLCRAIRVEEHHVDRTSRLTNCTVKRGTDDQVRDAVAV